MDIRDADLKRKIDELKRSFVEGLGARLSEIEGALERLRQDAPLMDQKDILRIILEQAHKIAGSAGTFGYGELGVTASEIERLCDRILKGKHGADGAAHGDLSSKIVALRAEAAS